VLGAVTPTMNSGTSRNGERRLRVALVSFEFAEVCVALANGLAAYVDVCLALPEEEVDALHADVSPDVLLRPFRKARLRQPLGQWRSCRQILGDVERFRPDIVHIQQGHFWLNLLGLPQLRRRYPLVLTVHDPSPHLGDRPSARTPQFLMSLGFRLAHQVIVHADAMRERVVREQRRHADEVHVVPHVSIPPGRPGETGFSGEIAHHPTVLFFGRIWPYKGLEYLIRAEPLVTAAVPDVEIVIAGGGETLDRYRNEMTHPERFTLREGFISRDERARLFEKAWVLVLPYVDATQSGVIPMAYACGTPVVATSVGGLGEMVDHGLTGLLVPPRAEAALADALISLLRDPRYCRQLGSRGREKAEKEWSPDTVARQTFHVYERAMAWTERTA
jgi:glycosyltransferase involved in cell wall biosynthesis